MLNTTSYTPKNLYENFRTNISKWILSKWRTLKSIDATTSEKPLDNHGKDIFEKESVHTEHIRKRKWAIPDDESDNWSKDVVEFFHAGDSAFCYSAVFFNNEKLDKRFLGTLLGYYDNGHLSSTVNFCDKLLF
ncbi:hypothetical protein R6Q57_010684 [Mikania cordata]